MAHPVNPTQYQISDLVRNAVRSVISAGQEYVTGPALMYNRSDVTAEVPRMEIDVTSVSRASRQIGAFDCVDIAGAGTSGVNGRYYRVSATEYVKGEYRMVYNNGQWEIENAAASVLYHIESASPVGSWITDDGDAPPPTGTAATEWFYNHFAADVSVNVVCDRYDGGATHHEDMVQSVRYLMSREAQAFVSPVVTFFEVLDLSDAGEAHDIREDEREDHTRLNFRFEVGLLPARYSVPSIGHSA